MNALKGTLALGLAAILTFSGLNYSEKKAEPVSAAGEYQLVWSDEFDGNTLNRDNWNVEVNGNGGGNNELQYYTDRTQNIEVSNGTLKIHALKEKYSNKNYTSGRITTQNKQTFKYGKVEARIKLPRFSGAWPAFWMLGNNISSVGWPKCGEMDIMEAINADNNVYANLHWSYQNNNADTNGSACNVGDRTAWHVYGMEWDENTAKFYVDNNYFQTYNITDAAEMQEFREKQFIILNLAIGGNWPGFNIDDSAFPNNSTMEVDYVRVYQKEPEPTTQPPETYFISEEVVDVVKDANKNFTTYNAGENSNWAGSAVISTESMTESGGTINISKVGTNIWGLQAHSTELEAIAGNTYDLSTTITTTADKQVRVKIRGNDSDDYIFFDKTLYLKANEPQTISEQISIPSGFSGFLKLDYGFGQNNETNEKIAENTSFTLTISNTSMTTLKKTYGIVDTPTSKNEVSSKNESTTKKEEVTKAVQQTQEQTGSSEPTSEKASSNDKVAQQIAEFQKKCGTAKIKVSVKKKSAKKIKVTLKKALAVADGYEVRVYKTRKNARKNKKVLAKFTTKTNKKSFKISNKKFKNKKKLFVRVRGYKKIGKQTIYSKKWSVTKKVKIK